MTTQDIEFDFRAALAILERDIRDLAMLDTDKKCEPRKLVITGPEIGVWRSADQWFDMSLGTTNGAMLHVRFLGEYDGVRLMRIQGYNTITTVAANATTLYLYLKAAAEKYE